MYHVWWSVSVIWLNELTGGKNYMSSNQNMQKWCTILNGYPGKSIHVTFGHRTRSGIHTLANTLIEGKFPRNLNTKYRVIIDLTLTSNLTGRLRSWKLQFCSLPLHCPERRMPKPTRFIVSANGPPCCFSFSWFGCYRCLANLHCGRILLVGVYLVVFKDAFLRGIETCFDPATEKNKFPVDCNSRYRDWSACVPSEGVSRMFESCSLRVLQLATGGHFSSNHSILLTHL